MSFEDALAENRPPTRVGPLRLRYEASLLIAEPFRVQGSFAGLTEALFVIGFGAAAGTVALLALPEDGASLPLTFAFGAIAVVSVLLAIAADRQRRARRAFVLNFATETLRVDWAEAWRRPQSAAVPFDAVSELRVVPTAAHRLGLELRFRPHPEAKQERTVRIVESVSERDRASLDRACRFLRNALGLNRPSAAAGDEARPGSPRPPWIEG